MVVMMVIITMKTKNTYGENNTDGDNDDEYYHKNFKKILN